MARHRRDERLCLVPGLVDGVPAGSRIWVHAVSVGEAMSALPVIDCMLRVADRHVILTVTTDAARNVMGRFLPAGVTLALAPLDMPGIVRSFIDHWRPDLVILMESEIWPVTLYMLDGRGVPVAVVNARMSQRSFSRWRRVPVLARPLFSRLTRVLARDIVMADRFARLGAPSVTVVGDIKAAAAPLPVDGAWLDQLKQAAGCRPVWLAASTHHGEEEIVAGVHILLERTTANPLTVLAPRHPERADTVERLLRQSGLHVGRLSQQPVPDATTQVFLIDRIGCLGTLYDWVPVAFIGGSMTSQGGHNPLEAIRHQCLPAMGPHTGKLGHDGERLRQSGALVVVEDGSALTRCIQSIWHRQFPPEAIAAERERLAACRTRLLDRLAIELEPLVRCGT
ncbi:MAG: 3-deoxy-D-manno-octulosonic acid transferase [Geminicoccaceae bacterium]|nr:3-deoxy-D-manno-octulosonic acid transferase [Geminicoccaceae bacterium]